MKEKMKNIWKATEETNNVPEIATLVFIGVLTLGMIITGEYNLEYFLQDVLMFIGVMVGVSIQQIKSHLDNK